MMSIQGIPVQETFWCARHRKVAAIGTTIWMTLILTLFVGPELTPPVKPNKIALFTSHSSMHASQHAVRPAAELN